MKKILIGWDGAPAGAGAVSLGGRIARAFEAEPTLIGISEDSSQQPALLSSLTEAQTRLRQEYQVEASILAAQGPPVERIARATAESNYVLLVIGGARAGGQAATALKLIRKVHSRILVAQQDTTRMERILLCSGGSRHSEKAVRFAGEMARRMGAQLTFFHVMASPPAVFSEFENEENPQALVGALGKVVQRQNHILDSLGVQHSVRLRYGFVLDELRKELAEQPYDLVVIGARQKGGGGFFLDDLTKEILESVACSVLVVRTVLEPSGGWMNRLRRWIRRR